MAILIYTLPQQIRELPSILHNVYVHVNMTQSVLYCIIITVQMMAVVAEDSLRS